MDFECEKVETKSDAPLRVKCLRFIGGFRSGIPEQAKKQGGSGRYFGTLGISTINFSLRNKRNTVQSLRLISSEDTLCPN